MQGVEKSYAAFTICNLAYLPKALVLAESFLRFNNKKILIYICERKPAVDLPTDMAEFVWIEDSGISNLYQLAFKYDITEFSTSLKPFLTLVLLREYDKVIFLDPDTCLYHSVVPILEDLDNHAIVLTPHYTTPESDLLPNSDIGMMRFGSFNLGFYAIRKSEQSISFLSWWNNRCQRLCYFETQFGLSTDQKWVSIAPCFFHGIYISFNLGYNVAFWNAHERRISKLQTGEYIVNEEFPLVFFHFSSFSDANPSLLTKRPFGEDMHERVDLIELSNLYSESLKKYTLILPNFNYSFDYMSGGEYISPSLRRAYACVVNELPCDHDPFDSNGPVGEFARKNHLIEKKFQPYVSSSYSDMAAHRIKFRIINSLLRIILRILGPNKFTNFSRLMVYLSSYRQNRELWKL